MNNEIELAVLAIDPDCSIDTIAAGLGKLEQIERMVRDLRKQAEARCIDWIQTNNQPIEFTVDDRGNTVRYYIGNRKDKKCRDVRATLQFLLEFHGGDVDAIANHLSSSAWKPGSIRDAIKQSLPAKSDPDWADGQLEDLFETVEKIVLNEKTGEPLKQLQKIDSRFIP